MITLKLSCQSRTRCFFSHSLPSSSSSSSSTSTPLSFLATTASFATSTCSLARSTAGTWFSSAGITAEMPPSVMLVTPIKLDARSTRAFKRPLRSVSLTSTWYLTTSCSLVSLAGLAPSRSASAVSFFSRDLLCSLSLLSFLSSACDSRRRTSSTANTSSWPLVGLAARRAASWQACQSTPPPRPS